MMLDPDRPSARRVIPELTREKLLALIAAGVTQTKACEALDIKPDRVRRWVLTDPVFAERHREACEQQIHTWVDEIVEIAERPAGDMAAVQRNKLEIDTKKWIAAKKLAERYGDKMMANHTHLVGVVLLPALDMAQHAITAQEKVQEHRVNGGLKEIAAKTGEGEGKP